MRFQALMASIVLVIATAAVALGDRAFQSEPIDGMRYETEITDRMLARGPKWNKADSNPPLSARAALALANDYVQRSFRGDKDWKRELESIALVPAEGRWYWQANYVWLPKVGFLSGGQPHLEIAVLMDGTVIPPKRVNDSEPSKTINKGFGGTRAEENDAKQ